MASPGSLPPQSGRAARLLRHLPQPIAANPERALINVAVMLIGLSAMIGARPPALARLWPFPLYEWAGVMLVGGAAVLAGMLRHNRSVERLGLILVCFGCLFYAGLLLVAVGWAGLFTALIFIFLAAAKAVRLVVSSAARASVIQFGEQMREAGEPPAEDVP